MPRSSPNRQLICRNYGSTHILFLLSLTDDTHENKHGDNCPSALRPIIFLVMVNSIIGGCVELDSILFTNLYSN